MKWDDLIREQNLRLYKWEFSVRNVLGVKHIISRQKMACQKLNLVVAACNNNGIGINGNLPWKLRKDMDFFKMMTSRVDNPDKQNAVIMGRKTWYSIPEKFRPLKGRVNIVLSRELKEVPEGVHIARSLPAALSLIQTDDLKNKIENIHIIGGSSVYQEAMTGPYPCRIYLTKVLKDFECDTFLPDIDTQQFTKIPNPDYVSVELQEENDIKFRFEVYEKCAPMKFDVMAAMCHGNRGIGCEMRLPWPSLQKDIDYYTTKTSTPRDKSTGKKIVFICGRKTWLSSPEKERSKTNVSRVIISQTETESTLNNSSIIKVVPSCDAALEFIDSIQNNIDSIWIMGGNRVYKEALDHNRCGRLYLTHVYKDFQADTFFPEFEDNFVEFKEHEEASKTYEESGVKFEFKVYEKKV